MSKERKVTRIVLWLLFGVVWFVIALALLIPFIKDLETARIYEATAHVIELTNNNVAISGPNIATRKRWTPTLSLEIATRVVP